MIRFGNVVVDIEARETRLDGELRHLEPQAFDLLVHLLSNGDRVVAKEELLDEVWGDQFVSESALTTRIKEIRRAVGDDGRTQAIVRNIRGRGYRFVAPLDETPSTADPSAAGLLGRAADLAAIEEALAVSSLVTLIGPGGVGKTTLARAAARTRAPHHADQPIFVDLTSVADPAAVGPAVHQAAGFASPAPNPNATVEALARLDTVVVVDNCEHVVDAVAAFLDRVVGAGGPVRVLATSRERLGVVGERVLPVAPLDADSARRLFIERAERAHPSHPPGEEEHAEIDRLVAALDHLPLAIEMAAGRMTALSLGDLGDLLDERLDLLRSPDRNTPERHQTLSSVVAWSEGLLSTEDRRVFHDLAVFAGPVPIDDIVGVLSVDRADRLRIVDSLTSLVDRSLLSADLAGRPATYRMLETVKAHVRPDGDRRLGHRHATWFLGTAEESDRDLRTPRERSGHDRFTAALAELRLAHRWARENDIGLAARLTGAVSTFGHTRLRGEPARWAAEIQAHLPHDDPHSPLVDAALAADASHRSDYARASRLAQRALDALGAAATAALGPAGHRAHAEALETLADVALYRGDLGGASRHGERLQRAGEEQDDLHSVVLGLSSRVLALVYGGDPEAGLTLNEEAPSLGELAPTDRGWVKYHEGEATVALRPDHAMVCYEEAIASAEPAGGRFLASVARLSLAAAIARHGDPADAVTRFGTIVRGFQRDGNVTHAVTTMRNLVELLVRVGADEDAMILLGGLSDDSVKATFGQEEARLEDCRGVVEGRAGTGSVERWMTIGAGTGVAWCLDHALRALDDVR